MRKYNRVPAGILTTETLQITTTTTTFVKCRVTTAKSVRNCSETCSDRQRYYIACTTHKDEYAETLKEYGGTTEALRNCLFDKGDFCFLKRNLTNPVLAECYAATPVSSTGIDCPATCRGEVMSYVQNTGCCVDYWKRYSSRHGRYYGPTISDIFSACGVEIPEPCTNLSPPAEFLNCAHEMESKAAERAGLTSLLVIIAVGFALITALLIRNVLLVSYVFFRDWCLFFSDRAIGIHNRSS